MDQSPVTVPEHMPHLVPDHEKSTSLRGHLGTKSQKCVSPKKKNPLRQTNGFLNLEWDVDGFPCDFRMPWDFHWMLQHSEAPNTRHGAGQADEHPLKKTAAGDGFCKSSEESLETTCVWRACFTPMGHDWTLLHPFPAFFLKTHPINMGPKTSTVGTYVFRQSRRTNPLE